MSEWSRNSAHGSESYFSMSSVSFTPSQYSPQPANQSASSSSSSTSPALSLSSKDFPALPSKFVLPPSLLFLFGVSCVCHRSECLNGIAAPLCRHHPRGSSRQRSRHRGHQANRSARARRRLSLRHARCRSSSSRGLRSVFSSHSRSHLSSPRQPQWTPSTVFPGCLTPR